MDSLFRRSKPSAGSASTRSRPPYPNTIPSPPNGGSTRNGLDLSPTSLAPSIPYDQIPKSKDMPTPVAGPGPTTMSIRNKYISSPTTNRELTQEGTDLRAQTSRRDSNQTVNDDDTGIIHRQTSIGSARSGGFGDGGSLRAPSRLGTLPEDGEGYQRGASGSGDHNPASEHTRRQSTSSSLRSRNAPTLHRQDSSSTSADPTWYKDLDPDQMPPEEEVNELFRRLMADRGPRGQAEGAMPIPHPRMSRNSAGGPEANKTASASSSTLRAPASGAVPDVHDLSTAKKWMLIQSDRQMNASRTDASRTEVKPAPYQTSLEDYLRIFRNPDSITWADANALGTSVRTRGTRTFMKDFLDKDGQSIMARALLHFTTRIQNSSRTSSGLYDRNDLLLELEILRGLAKSLNRELAPEDALKHERIAVAIIGSLVSPTLASRKLAAEILTFLACCQPLTGYEYIQRAFITYTESLTLKAPILGRYQVWLKAMSATLDGRGRMGSKVGASAEMKTAMIGSNENQPDIVMGEYCQAQMFLINVLICIQTEEDKPQMPDLPIRVNYRMEMERCGVLDLFQKMDNVDVDRLHEEISTYHERSLEDDRETRHLQDHMVLKDLRNIDDIVLKLHESLDGTIAQSFFRSILRHLVFVKDNGDERILYFDLIDRLVSGVVLDGRPGMTRDFESISNLSVQRVLGRFADINRMERDQEYIKDLKDQNMRLQADNEALREEMEASGGDMISALRKQLHQSEEGLKASRAAHRALEGDMEELREAYEAKIRNLMDYIHLLLGLAESGLGMPSNPEEEPLIRADKLKIAAERAKTKDTLEGRPRGKGKAQDEDDDLASTQQDPDSNVDADIGSDDVGAPTLGPKPKRSEIVSGSQFVDADDEKVREHIEIRLQAEDSVSPRAKIGGLPRSARSRASDLSKIASSPNNNGPAIGQKSPARYAGLARPPGLSRVMDELRMGHGSIRRSASEPGYLSTQSDSSNDFISGEALDSTGSTAPTLLKTTTSFADQLAERARGLKKGSHEKDLSIVDEDEIDEDLPQSPSPPMSGKISSDETAPPPRPQPPVAMAGLLSAISGGINLRKAVPSTTSGDTPPQRPPGMPGMAGLLSAISGGINLRKGATGSPSGLGLPMVPARRASKNFADGRTPAVSENRKEVGFTASRKMKQLQWEKVQKAKVKETVWGESEEVPQDQWEEQLKKVDVWNEMEDEFKAREIAFNTLAKKKKEELKSVLSPSVRKHVEILMARTKRMDPEELCDRIRNFDPELCNNTFLSELTVLIPTPELVSLLKQQNAETPDQLLLLHPADRLMIQLIKIPRLADRLKGMLYKVNFDESMELLDKGIELLQQACDDLREAKQFKALLNVILVMGNYMNGTNYGGGAYGFKINSINKLVDTKSTNGQNLLHFLERTVSQHFPGVQGFRKELEKPAEAYRVSYEELSSSAKVLKNDLLKIRRDIRTELDNLERDQLTKDSYLRRMNTFVDVAEDRVETLSDRVLLAGHAFNSVKSYYGEGDDRFDPTVRTEIFSKPTSLEFFGVFKTFITSWDICKAQNKMREEARAANEKRKIKIERKQTDALSPQSTGASSTMASGALEDLHARLLKQGTPRAKRERRQRDIPRTPDFDSFDFSTFSIDGFGDDTTGDALAEAARNMLGQLGETAPTPAELGIVSGRTKSRSSLSHISTPISRRGSELNAAAMLEGLQLTESPPTEQVDLLDERAMGTVIDKGAVGDSIVAPSDIEPKYD